MRWAVVILLAIACCTGFVHGQSVDPSGSNPGTSPPTADDMLKQMDLLVQQNEQLEKQNHELMNVILTRRSSVFHKKICSSM